MGKGDKKTRKGKIVNKSYGVRRKKNTKKLQSVSSSDKSKANINIKSPASVNSEVIKKPAEKPAAQKDKKEEIINEQLRKEKSPQKSDKKPAETKLKEKTGTKKESSGEVDSV